MSPIYLQQRTNHFKIHPLVHQLTCIFFFPLTFFWLKGGEDGRPYVAYKTVPQMHYFNCPFQLGGGSPDTTDLATKIRCPLVCMCVYIYMNIYIYILQCVAVCCSGGSPDIIDVATKIRCPLVYICVYIYMNMYIYIYMLQCVAVRCSGGSPDTTGVATKICCTLVHMCMCVYIYTSIVDCRSVLQRNGAGWIVMQCVAVAALPATTDTYTCNYIYVSIYICIYSYIYQYI